MKKWLGVVAGGLALAWALRLVPTAQSAVATARSAFEALAAQAEADRAAVWVACGVVAFLALVLGATWTVALDRRAGGSRSLGIAAQVALVAVLVGTGVHLIAEANVMGALLLAGLLYAGVRKAERAYRHVMGPLA